MDSICEHAGGRYMNDVWLLNLDTLDWQLVTTSAKPLPPIGGGKFDEIVPVTTSPLLGFKEEDSKPGSTAALPPSAGHVLVAWGSTLLCIGGHTKAGTYSHARKVLIACHSALAAYCLCQLVHQVVIVSAGCRCCCTCML